MNSDEFPIQKPDLTPEEINDSQEPTNLEAESIKLKSEDNNTDVEFVEKILQEIEQEAVPPAQVEQLTQQVSRLEQQKQTLEAEINALQELRELEQRKQALEVSIEQLERRRDRIREEMRTSFAGVSQELAIRVQGFKDYLVGSLQDLAASAEQLELPTFEKWEQPQPRREVVREVIRQEPVEESPKPQFAQQKFQDQTREIQKILEQYRSRPDYYGPPWQLRRTFEPIHAERVQNWFFNQGGRGSIRSMGSRLQNILIASAAISVMHRIYGDRARTLVLANTPERLGEWRRGLQDCLGISRSDFGPDRGVTLFESPEALVQKADRLVESKRLPLVIIDETEDRVNLSLLQFPLWLAFAGDPQQMGSYMY
jgi:small-conductance mechanosensitive channel